MPSPLFAPASCNDRSPKEKKGAEARKPRTGAKVSPAVEPVYHAGARMKAAVRADDLFSVEPIGIRSSCCCRV